MSDQLSGIKIIATWSGSAFGATIKQLSVWQYISAVVGATLYIAEAIPAGYPSELNAFAWVGILFFSLGAFLLTAIIQWCWNLLWTPYRTERDRRKEAEKKLEEFRHDDRKRDAPGQ